MDPNQLQLVRNQAEQKQQVLSERLEKAIAFVGAERYQLAQLKEYESGYLDRIQREQHQWSVENSHRYRSFCHKLAEAIKEQESKLRQAEKHLQELRQSVFQQQQRVNILDDLLEREALSLAQQQSRHLQKELDDLTARRYCR